MIQITHELLRLASWSVSMVFLFSGAVLLIAGGWCFTGIVLALAAVAGVVFYRKFSGKPDVPAEDKKSITDPGTGLQEKK